MLDHDPIFIKAELAYRRERALTRASRWEQERPHPVREALGRWWRQALPTRGTTPEQSSPVSSPEPRTTPAERPLPEAPAEPATEARAFEHTAA